MLDRLMLLVAPLAFAFFLSVGAWETSAPRQAIVHPAVRVEVFRTDAVAASSASSPAGHGAPCTHRTSPAVRVS
jgi:hypothetical protein